MIRIGFHRISSIFIEFDEIRRFVRFLERMLAQAKEAWAAPTRKNVGSLDPSKEQGARLDLSSLV